MRVLITGSRDWYCPDLAKEVVSRLVHHYGPGIVLVHGAARGVDQSFAEAGEDLGVDQEPHPADWDAHGRVAGPKRNAEMIRLGAQICFAFSRDLAKSKGIRGCTRLAIEAGIPTWVISDETATAVRLTLEDPRLK